MYEGFLYRLRTQVRPFALQSFITQSMFSKDVLFENTLHMFEQVVGLPSEDA